PVYVVFHPIFGVLCLALSLAPCVCSMPYARPMRAVLCSTPYVSPCVCWRHVIHALCFAPCVRWRHVYVSPSVCVGATCNMPCVSPCLWCRILEAFGSARP